MDLTQAAIIINDEIEKHLSLARLCKETIMSDGHNEVAEALSLIMGEAGMSLSHVAQKYKT